MKTETDPTNGTNYSIVGTSQLLSVPYALNASNAGNGFNRVSATGDTLFWENGKSVIIPGISSANNTNTPGTVTDASGNTYPTVTIGTQVWMAENLRTTKYRNNTPITNITDNTQWQNNTTGAWSYYNNDATNNNPYGKLYNWYAVNNSNGICPTGWHVPTDAEWTTLTTSLGGESVAGGKMKSTGTQYWLSPNTDATNSSGWSGLPGGYRFDDGSFNDVGDYGFWWSSTEYNTGVAWSRVLSYSLGVVGRNGNDKNYGFSVRCLRD